MKRFPFADLSCLVLVGLLCPAILRAQSAQAAEAQTVVSGFSGSEVGGRSAVEALLSPGGGASRSPSSSYEAEPGDRTISAQPFTAHADWGWANAWLAHSVTLPAVRSFSAAANNWVSRDWSNGLSAGALANLGNGRQTYIYAATDLERYNHQENIARLVESDGSVFTLRWGISHSLPTHKNSSSSLELGINGYEQRLASDALLLAGPSPTLFPGASLHTEGLGATIALPKKNLLFSMNYATQHGKQMQGKNHLLVFALFWSW